jgi:hypothetical protein
MLFKSVILTVLTFMFIFGWKLHPYVDGITLWSIFLITLCFPFYRRWYKAELQIVFLLALLVTYTSLITVMHGSIELLYPLRSLRALINFLGAIGLVGLFQHLTGKRFADELLMRIFIALTLHAALIFFMYVWEPGRETVYRLTSAYTYVNLNTPFLTGLRIPGLTYSLAQTSVLQMFGLLLAPFVYRQFRYKVLFWSCIILLVFSVFITGRTGLALAVFLVPLAVLFSSPKDIGRTVLMGFPRLAVIFVILLLIVEVLPLPEKFYGYTLVWTSELLDVIKNPAESEFVKTMATMYFLPSDAWTFVFGSSATGRDEVAYIPSDVGYVLLIFGVGILGLMLMITVYVIGLFDGIRVYRIHRGISLGVVLVVISVLLLNLKEVSLLTRNQFSVFSLLVCGAIRAYRTLRVKG